VENECSREEQNKNDCHDEWEIEYLFVMVKDKCCCLICNASVSLPKKGNLERHYNALYSNKYDADFPPKSEIRKLSCSTTVDGRSLSNNATKLSFKVTNLIVKKCKPFTEGEFVKVCFLEIANNFSEGFKK
jgi:hypothetical protein